MGGWAQGPNDVKDGGEEEKEEAKKTSYVSEYPHPQECNRINAAASSRGDGGHDYDNMRFG